MFNEWCTIESDPAVFTELIHRIGVPAAQVEEIYSLEDEELLRRIQPIYGFIFLFKWTKDTEPRETLEIYDKQLFFANQVINNACATQAILSVLLNTNLPIGGYLKDFQEFARELDSYDRGLALSNSDQIREIHNSFSRPEPFVFKEDKKKKKKEQEAFHFISYVPFKGALYELDGLQKGPIKLGTFQNGDWISLAKVSIENRIRKYSEKEIRFTLLAICQNLKSKSQQSVVQLNQTRINLLSVIDPTSPVLQELKLKYPDYQPQPESVTSNEEAQQTLQHLQLEISEHQATIQQEDIKAEQRRKENVRRKHNYIPLILHLLKTAAKTGKLSEIIQNKLKS